MDACRKFSQSRHNESNVIPNVVRAMRPLVKWLYIHVARSDRKCEGGGEEANGNKFKLNCYIYMHTINNWSRDGHIRGTLRKSKMRAESTRDRNCNLHFLLVDSTQRYCRRLTSITFILFDLTTSASVGASIDTVRFDFSFDATM